MLMQKMLKKEFFERPTLTVARDLIGKFIVRKVNGKTIALMVTETEAYDGHHDKASHAHRGMTERNKVMFGEAGTWYVYFTYGMHWMLNVVTGPEGYPAAVLIRAAGDVVGPARLTKALAIDKKLNMKKVRSASGLWLEDRVVKVKKGDIARTSRIGIRYAAEWAEKPYRFVLKKQK